MDLDAGRGRSILAELIGALSGAGASPIVVVTGAHREAVEATLAEIKVAYVHNPAYIQGSMLQSIQAGLRYLRITEVEGALIAPGDHPAVRVDTIRRLMAHGRNMASGILIPSYRMRRGHPILVPRLHWEEILGMPGEASMRDFLAQHEGHIEHVVVGDPGVLFDVDTPEDYRRLGDGNRRG